MLLVQMCWWKRTGNSSDLFWTKADVSTVYCGKFHQSSVCFKENFKSVITKKILKIGKGRPRAVLCNVFICNYQCNNVQGVILIQNSKKVSEMYKISAHVKNYAYTVIDFWQHRYLFPCNTKLQNFVFNYLQY